MPLRPLLMPPRRAAPQTAASTSMVGQTMGTAGKAIAAMGAAADMQKMQQDMMVFG